MQTTASVPIVFALPHGLPWTARKAPTPAATAAGSESAAQQSVGFRSLGGRRQNTRYAYAMPATQAAPATIAAASSELPTSSNTAATATTTNAARNERQPGTRNVDGRR